MSEEQPKELTDREALKIGIECLDREIARERNQQLFNLRFDLSILEKRVADLSRPKLPPAEPTVSFEPWMIKKEDEK